jgi:hypothetical protein
MNSPKEFPLHSLRCRERLRRTRHGGLRGPGTKARSSRVTRDPHGIHVGRAVLPCAIFTRPLHTLPHHFELESQWYGIPALRERRAEFHRICLGGILMPAPHPLTHPPSHTRRDGAGRDVSRTPGADGSPTPAHVFPDRAPRDSPDPLRASATAAAGGPRATSLSPTEPANRQSA